MSHRYDDLREWLNEDPRLVSLTRRPLTDAELAALMAMWATLVIAALVAAWLFL
jgi:hypothetical protein